MRQRDYHHKKAINSNNPADWSDYKLLRNKVNSSIRRAKENYYKSQLNENQSNPKGIWKILKKLIPKSNNSASIIIIIFNC